MPRRRRTESKRTSCGKLAVHAPGWEELLPGEYVKESCRRGWLHIGHGQSVHRLPGFRCRWCDK